MISILFFIFSLWGTPYTVATTEIPTNNRVEEDALLQYQQFIRDDAKEHRLFLENSFNKLLMLISGGTFLFGSVLAWLNYRTKTEIKVAINKKFDEKIDNLLETRINELRHNLEIQSKEWEKKIETADKLIRELSSRLSKTSPQRDKETVNERDVQHTRYAGTEIKRILWVDDNPENNKSIVSMFTENEIVFDIVKSTDEAIKKLAKNNYTLIISDMKRAESPDAGIQLLKLRNKKYSNTPIAIFSSSRSLVGYAHTAESEGANLVTNKVTELLGYIQTIIG